MVTSADERTDNESYKFGGTGPDNIFVKTSKLNSLVTEPYDYISLGYTGTNLTTVTYKINGSSGTTVATLTLAYTGSVLDSVTKA